MLEVRDAEHRAHVAGTIRFEGSAESSCMGDGWKRVVVEQVRQQDDAFFPIDDPIAWHVTDGTLTFGLVSTCDAYRLLSGPASASSIEGAYYHWGKGGRQPLGDFSLHRVP